MVEIDITRFFNEAAPMDYSASVAEIGTDAGPSTWRAACDDSPDYPELLATEDQREAFRGFVRSSGGWTDKEIRQWSDDELRALFIQWISGDMRECGMLPGLTEDEWREIESRQSEGRTPSNIYRGDDGRIYFYCGS